MSPNRGAINAVGVLRALLLMSIWDDGYGISVPNEHQITKEDLSDLLAGSSAGVPRRLRPLHRELQAFSEFESDHGRPLLGLETE